MSTQETTDNFLEFWQNYQWPDLRPITYRLYHDDQGRPLFYTMEDLPGQYIEVDQETYIYGSFEVRVVDGRLMVLPSKRTVRKLCPETPNGTPCDLRDVCVVVDTSRSHRKWGMEEHENN